MTYGAEIWGPPLIAAAGSYLSGKGTASNESKNQRTQRHLVDQLISSLSGSGPFSDLFGKDENAFQKSFVEPAQSMFRNQIAPQIQQQYIASGQQGGTGLDDQLLRAGVDLDSMLNQQMYQFNQDALSRKQGSINSILGAGSGAANMPTGAQNVMSGLSGYLSGDQFSDQFAKRFQPNQPGGGSTANPMFPPRRGFAADRGQQA